MAKPKKCPECGEPFIAERMGQKTCRKYECAISFGRKLQDKKKKAVEKAKRQEIKQRKEKLKTRGDWTKEAQVAFNAFIRERDKALPCICCGEPLELDAVGGGYDCGHYRSVGSAPHLRFDESNAHGQRKVCNRYGSGRAVDYRKGLIDRIGLAAVEVLEADQSSPKWTIDDLRLIRDKYRAKLRELKRNE